MHMTSVDDKSKCFQICKDREEATGCEWKEDSKDCIIHHHPLSHGSGNLGNICLVLTKGSLVINIVL